MNAEKSTGRIERAHATFETQLKTEHRLPLVMGSGACLPGGKFEEGRRAKSLE